MTNLRAGVLAAIFCILLPFAAPAHEGHSHGDEEPPPTVITAPRATGLSPLFQLVAVANGPALMVYIDRSETNEPVTGAEVSVETPAGPVNAQADGEVYLLDAPWATETGDYKLLFTVVAGVDIDFVTATLTIPEALPVAEPASPMAALWQLLGRPSRVDALKLAALAEAGTIPAAQLEEVELTLQGLREQRAALGSQPMNAKQLVAPVAGIVSKVNAASGLIAETNTEVFHIIDPAKLWVEASLFVDETVAGTASVADEDGEAIPLTVIGKGFAEDGQARPAHLRVDDLSGRLMVGERVTVYAETTEVATGIGVPRDALIHGANGESIVFLHVGPELFEPRAVRIEPLDSGSVLIVAGLAEGDRVVTQGAELLNQLR